ncbi:MAG TPA: MFS transporter [Candidatus Udaeobacter sp.]|nr:MFS transporter [Candidatus Udaeobacter sp.]
MSESETSPAPKPRAPVPRAVWMLGLTSLFMDMSTELIQSLLPLFMVSVLGAPIAVVGLIEGMAEATASFTKILSGAVSDQLGKRKALALAGYGLAALSKPFFPLAQGLGTVFMARFLDRIGKGVRDAPRDALIADIVPPESRGAAYGLRQALDTLGALGAPLLAFALMWLFAGNFRHVFWFACIPALFSVLTLAFGVPEPAVKRSAERRPFPLRPGELARLGSQFWLLIGAILLLLLPRFSESLLLLRASGLGLANAWVPLVMAAMNLVYAPVAAPAGRLADRVGRIPLLFAGTVVLVAAQTLLALAGSPALVFAGAMLWGLQNGLIQGAMSALVADAAPKDLAGTAFGVFNLVSGLAVLAGSWAAGEIWDLAGASASFLAGAAAAALGLAALGLLPRRGTT